MPPPAPAEVRPPGQRRAPAAFWSPLWFTLAGLSLGAGVAGSFFVQLEASQDLRRWPDELAAAYAPGVFLVCAGLGFWFLGRTVGRARARKLFALPLLCAALTLAACSVLFLCFVSGRREYTEEKALSATLLVVGLLVSYASALFLRNGILKADQATAARAGDREAPAAGGGGGTLWFFGSALMLASFASLALGNLFGTGFAAPLLAELGYRIDPRRASELVAIAKHESLHVMPAACIFVPALFLLLAARRAGGAAHVLRGAAGWIIFALILGAISVQLPDVVHLTEPGRRVSYHIHDYRGTVAPEQVELSMCLLLGVIGGLLLVWPPARRGEAELLGTAEVHHAV